MKTTRQAILSTFQKTATTNPLERFADFNVSQFDKLLRNKSEDYWNKQGEQKALRVFHESASNVPAYRDFLKKRRINPEKINSIEDFKKIPITTKENYINTYDIADRCIAGDMSHRLLVAASSGTSGAPKLWPRGTYQEFEAAAIHELLYTTLFQIQKYRTLILIGFPMGIYVSGMATTIPSWLVATKKYPVTLLTVGNNKDEILQVLPSLKGEYEQIIFVGHPFFIKDVLESARDRSIDFTNQKIRTLFCSEGFSEEWRDYIASLAPNVDPQRDILSTYGSSELLLMGYETPFSVALRREITNSSVLQEKITPQRGIPSVFQYNPLIRYIESIGNDLLFTSGSGIPLIRYNIHDSGAVFSSEKFLAHIENPSKVLQIAMKNRWNLPLVTLDGRSDQTIIFYAANIYPEHIHAALNQKSFLSKITGKFAIKKEYNKKMDEILRIYIELRPNKKPSSQLTASISQHIVDTLKAVNLEYLFLWDNLNKDIRPKIALCFYQDSKFFKPGKKPKYIISS